MALLQMYSVYRNVIRSSQSWKICKYSEALSRQFPFIIGHQDCSNLTESSCTKSHTLKIKVDNSLQRHKQQ